MGGWKTSLVFAGLVAAASFGYGQGAAKESGPGGPAPMAPARPVPVIFDTDIGNDCDDVLAMAMLHSLATRKEVDLLAVTITKDHPLAPRYVSALNTYYRRPGPLPGPSCSLAGQQRNHCESLARVIIGFKF